MGTLSAQFLTLLVIYGLPQYAQSSVALFATGFAPPIRRRRASPGAGSSSNPVYVTLADNVLPEWAKPIMLTYVKLAVGNGGATSQAAALASTWAQFSTGNGPADVRTWDGRSMSYYAAGFYSCATRAWELVTGLYPSAQCGAFAYLLESALAVNGIHSNWITVDAEHQPTPGTSWSMLVIRNWCFVGANGCPAGSPTYPSEPDYKYLLTTNIGDDPMFPQRHPSDFGDLTNLEGVGGQGSANMRNPDFNPPYTPVEKVFARHFIVRVLELDGQLNAGEQYFDPSYGLTYPSEGGFESRAVSGYAYQFSYEVGTGEWHVSRPKLSPNIRFRPDPLRSM
jgi:hypothetical protein